MKIRHPKSLLALWLAVACGAGPSAPPPVDPATAASAAETAPQATTRSPIGINLSGIQAYTTAFPFMDVFKQSSPWISSHGDVWNDGRHIDVDDHGWVRRLSPGQTVHTIFIDHTVEHAPPGQYLVTYDGEGEITYGEGARLVEHAPGSDVVEVDPSQGNCWLGIVSVNPRSHIRNIRIRLPVRVPESEVFHPFFVERIRGFRVLRFMGWMLGDNDEQIVQRRWIDRPLVEDARWSERGVPAEVMVDLANRVGADPWFSIPHHADDDYVRRFAEVVRDRLAPGRKAYVEHSNEVWNSNYSVHAYAAERGLALGLSADTDEARFRYHARRSREIFGIFTEVLGADRVVRVLAAQQDGPWVAETLLGYKETARHVDALAIGAYFGYELGLPDSALAVRRMTLDDLFREIETRTLPGTIRGVRENALIAERYGLPLIAYEGGQHLSPVMTGVDDPEINALFDAANRDPRMGRIYTHLLTEWDAASGHGLFLHLNECDRMGPYGRWGLLEYINQPRRLAPKYDAVMRWIEGGASARDAREALRSRRSRRARQGRRGPPRREPRERAEG